MPVARQIPDSQRRSRKGCLTCRRRRRKCDEGKPACQNCCSRDVTCRYADWTFVPQGPVFSNASSEPPGDPVDRFSISTVATIPTPPQEAIIAHYSHAHGMDASSTSHIHSPPTTQPSTFTHPLAIAAGQSAVDGLQTASWASTDVGDHSTYDIETPTGLIDETLPQRGSKSADSALLRFRYEVIPWIDANNCKSTFGPTIITLARESKVFSDCVVHCMQSRDRDSGIVRALSDGSSTFPRLLEQLTGEDALTADVGRALLAISNVFCKPPSEWADISSLFERYCNKDFMMGQTFGSTPEPLKTLLRVQLKIDLASSVIASKPPSSRLIMPPAYSILNDVNQALQSYDECLCCLANSLRLIHNQLIPLLSGFHDSHPQATSKHESAWEQWSDLWTTCTIWFQTRPRDMEPVFEGAHVSDDQAEPFPIDVFTSATALQANLVMHMSAIILLAHRPRLGDVVGLSHRLGSRSWHVNKIASMLIGNHFHEQWDPIVIAALLFVAKEMSHVSQQEALLGCFQEVASATQIPVKRDIADLRARWQSVYQEGPPDVSHLG